MVPVLPVDVEALLIVLRINSVTKISLAETLEPVNLNLNSVLNSTSQFVVVMEEPTETHVPLMLLEHPSDSMVLAQLLRTFVFPIPIAQVGSSAQESRVERWESVLVAQKPVLNNTIQSVDVMERPTETHALLLVPGSQCSVEESAKVNVPVIKNVVLVDSVNVTESVLVLEPVKLFLESVLQITDQFVVVTIKPMEMLALLMQKEYPSVLKENVRKKISVEPLLIVLRVNSVILSMVVDVKESVKLSLPSVLQISDQFVVVTRKLTPMLALQTPRELV